jgi:hypothetical protein
MFDTVGFRRWLSLPTIVAILACSSRSETPSSYRPSPLAQAAIDSAEARGSVVSNEIWISSTSGNTLTNRPFTISRFFAQREIADCPQAVVEDEAVESQCDVKTRWADGSVQHALVTFFATVPGRGRLRVRFINQAKGDETGLTRDQMFEFADGKWGAGIAAGARVVDDSEPVFVNAKDILSAWDSTPADTRVRYWLRGPLVTQVIVEDKSAGTPFDFGWTSPFGVVRNSSLITRSSTEAQIFREYARDLATWTPQSTCT